MSPEDELIERSRRAAEQQIELTHSVLAKHLDESDQIHARRASETIVQMAADLVAANPT
jgi:hypothetical protein